MQNSNLKTKQKQRKNICIPDIEHACPCRNETQETQQFACVNVYATRYIYLLIYVQGKKVKKTQSIG